MNISWRGVYPAVTTHFHDDQSLDVPGTLRHVDGCWPRRGVTA